MAVDQGPDALEQATRALRADDDGGWIELSQTIMSRVRTLVSPAEPVDTFTSDGVVERGSRRSTIKISGRVLTPALRAAADAPTRAADSIDIEVVGGRCVAVRVGLVGVYGADLQHEGDLARRSVEDTLRTVLGPDPEFDIDRDIEITFVDVVVADPHRE